MGTCRPHPCSSAHARLVAEFRLAAYAWDIAAETYAAGGGATEIAEYARDFPRPTFSAWLSGMRQEAAA